MHDVELIPLMTSNTTPEGTASSENLSQDAYKVFDRNGDTYIETIVENTYGIVNYEFDEPVHVNKIEITMATLSMSGYYKDFIFDVFLFYNNSWNKYGSFTLTGTPGQIPSTKKTYVLEEKTLDKKVTKIKIESQTIKSDGNGFRIYEVVAYGIKFINKTGDIFAIRDWFNGSLYNKGEIDQFFIENNDYAPYEVTIINEPGSVVTVIGQQSDKRYTLEISESKSLTKLLFFTEGEYIIASLDTDHIEVHLSERQFTIDFLEYSEDYYMDFVSPPTKTTYVEGEQISTAGMSVHMYNSEGTDLGPVNTMSYISEFAELREGPISFNYPDAFAYDANEVLFTHNGSYRTPIVKINDGEAICMLGANCAGSDWGGNWHFPILIAKDAESTIYKMGSDSPLGSGAWTFNNMTFYVAAGGTNPNYGGFSEFYNPKGFPECHDEQLFTVNAPTWTQEYFMKVVKFLRLGMKGGALTLKARDYNGKLMQLQYGLEVEPNIPDIQLVFKAENQPTTQGTVKDYTYTAEKNGYYLILYWDFMPVQLMTDLSDVIISGQVLDSYNYPHIKYWICRLKAGDEVVTRITTQPNSGYGFYSALIFKLNAIIDRNSVELYKTFDRQDGTTSYEISSDSYKHLIFTSWQYNGTNSNNQTDTSVRKGDAMTSEIVSTGIYSGNRISTCVYYGDKDNLPTPIKNYSWGWGRGQLVDIITKK